MNEEQVELGRPELGRVAHDWLAGTLRWEARLQTLRIRADLALATGDVAEVAPRRDHLVAVMASARPDVEDWTEHLDRTA